MGSKSLQLPPDDLSGSSLSLTPEEQKIKSLWTALQVAEKQNKKRGLQFGEAMYEYREKHSAQGRRTDLLADANKSETFMDALTRLGVGYDKANYWINKYEETIGERQHESPVVQEPLSPEPELEISQLTPSLVIQKEQDRESLTHLTKRFVSLTKAVQQLLDDRERWSQHAEYVEIKSASAALASLIEQL